MQKKELKITQIDSNQVMKKGESYQKAQARKRELPQAQKDFITYTNSVKQDIKNDIKTLQNYAKNATLIMVCIIVLSLLISILSIVLKRPFITWDKILFILILSVLSMAYGSWLTRTVDAIKKKKDELDQYK